MIQTQIQQGLEAIEAREDVQIIYACESGSRAWGFPSADSDYDIRFLYLRSLDWYLSIDVEVQRDVIEQPIEDALDFSGWDVRKALKLLRKSNPPLLEWLNSPIVYAERSDIVARLRNLLTDFYSPVAAFHHYLHMARGNYRDYLHGEIVWIKKYFYVLRPLLAIRWIEAGRDIVPVRFDTLLDSAELPTPLRAAISELIVRKRQGDELARAPRIPIISDFIAAEIARLETAAPPTPVHVHRDNALDQFFRWIVLEKL